ncbi:MAG TPA: hypothetical protein ENH40_01570, partial [Nitrospirae bacterium]|nr:hypothetical protein [Nitrospirota bacterium]
MSFILDALKKLDSKRHQGSVPDLMSVHDITSQKPKKRSPWPYIILAALIVNAGVLLVLFRPWQTEILPLPAETKTEPKASQQTVQKPAETNIQNTAETVKPIKTEIVKQLPPVEAKEDIETADQPVDKETYIRENFVVEPPRPDEIIITPDTQPASDTPAVETASDEFIDGSGRKIPGRDELPASVQQGLPEITISAHIYSNETSSRMISINGSVLMQGDSVVS